MGLPPQRVDARDGVTVRTNRRCSFNPLREWSIQARIAGPKRRRGIRPSRILACSDHTAVAHRSAHARARPQSRHVQVPRLVLAVTDLAKWRGAPTMNTEPPAEGCRLLTTWRVTGRSSG